MDQERKTCGKRQRPASPAIRQGIIETLFQKSKYREVFHLGTLIDEATRWNV